MLFVIWQNIIARKARVPQIPRHPSIIEMALKTLMSVFLMLSVVIGDINRTLTHPVVRAIGVIIMLIGLWLSMESQRELGRNWVGGIGLHKQHKLITTGPYRYVRHPLYSGLLVSSLGFGLVSLNIWMFLMGLSFCGSFAFRIPGEEALLRQKFKKKFDDYAEHTGRLIPKFR